MSGRFTVETVFKATDNTSGVLGTITARTRAMERALATPNAIVNKGFAGLRSMGMAAVAATAGAVGLGLAFKEAITPGADFDQAMSAVGAVSLMTRDQVADLEKEARRLGKTTKFSATEVAGGMELMGKAGFDNSQIIAGIGPLLSAAAAEGMEFEQTASVVSNVIKGMGMQMSDTARVADVLTLASARTNSSISSLGESMAIGAPTARQRKVPFEDATAAVAMLQDQGLDASVAGSAVATMLTNLAKPPKDVAAKMKAMGVSFQDAKGNMLPFREVVAQLAKAGTKAGGNMAQVAFFADLVGMRGQKAALNLKDIGPALQKLTGDLYGATGSAEKMAALKMDNFLGDVKLLGNEVKDLAIDFFDLVKGPLRNAARGTREWLDANQGLIKSDVAGWVKGLTDNIGSMRENIDKGVIVLDFFRLGLKNAFKHSASVAVFGKVLDTVFGGKDGEGPGKKAYDLGYGIAYAVDKFILFTGIVKAAELGVFLFSNATKIAKAATVAWEVAVVGTKATMMAFEAAAGVGAASITSLAIAEQGAAVATTSLGAASGPAAAGISSIGAAAAASAASIGAAAAMIGSLLWAAYELKKLTDVSGGLEGVGNGLGGGLNGFVGNGTKSWGINGFLQGYAQGVDDYQNEQAVRAYQGDPTAAPAWGTNSAQDAAATLTGRSGSKPNYLDAFGIGMPAPGRPPGPYADGYAMPGAEPPPAPPPMLASTRDRASDETAKSNAALRASLDALASKLNGSGGTIKLILPKGVTAEKSGAPGVEVTPSGAF